MASGTLTVEIEVAPGDVRTVDIDPAADLTFTPDEYVMFTGFLAGVGVETDEQAQTAAAVGVVLVHLARALPDVDPITLARALRDVA